MNAKEEIIELKLENIKCTVINCNNRKSVLKIGHTKEDLNSFQNHQIIHMMLDMEDKNYLVPYG